MTAFDYKKEYRALYLPKDTPSVIDVPPMQYAAVRGCGNPNEEGGMGERLQFCTGYPIRLR